MKKRILCCLMAMALFVSSGVTALAEEELSDELTVQVEDSIFDAGNAGETESGDLAGQGNLQNGVEHYATPRDGVQDALSNNLSNPQSIWMMTKSVCRWYSFYDEIAYSVRLEELYWGDEANAIVEHENMFNQKASDSQQWLLFKFFLKNDGKETLEASDVFPTSSVFYTRTGASISPEISSFSEERRGYGIYDVSLEPGASNEVWIGILIKKSVGFPYLRLSNGFDENKSKARYAWFDTDPNYVTAEDSVRAFVNRLYSVGLGRTPDEEGLSTWSNLLASGQKNAVDVVQGVLCSPEYLNKGKSNGDMVKDCYLAMLNRDPDIEGYNNWVKRLDSGMSVNAIFAGFVGSPEFIDLCNQYGITPGTYPLSDARDWNAGVTMFVSRLYTEALGRGYDINGLNDWCTKINNDSSKGNIMNVATNGFFHSSEFLGKGLSNTEFVKVLYRTFLGRDYDEAGLNTWVGLLDRGEKSRDEVMEGFAYSEEFENIMASYGL